MTSRFYVKSYAYALSSFIIFFKYTWELGEFVVKDFCKDLFNPFERSKATVLRVLHVALMFYFNYSKV